MPGLATHLVQELNVGTVLEVLAETRQGLSLFTPIPRLAHILSICALRMYHFPGKN